MEFLFVSMAVGFLLPMGKNEDLGFVQTIRHMVAFDDCSPHLLTIFCLGQLAERYKFTLC